MKTLQACSGLKTHTDWTGPIKRLIQRYLGNRRKPGALERASAENEVETPCEGRRWCDATERELIDNITKMRGPKF